MKLKEHYLYGSSRLGIINRDQDVDTDKLTAVDETNLGDTYLLNFTRGNKLFELTNHLGNVLTVLSDKKTGRPKSGDPSMISIYDFDMVTASDYTPFGMVMLGRNFSFLSRYRYGFNGQELDNEVKGAGNLYNAEFWMYDPLVGRRWNVDPIVKESESPYAAFSNNPIWFIDPYGADTTKPNALGKLDDVLTGGQMKNQQKVQMLEAGIKNQVQGITINKNLKEQAFNDLLNSTAGSDEFKSNLDLYNDYQSQEQNHSKALGWMLGELYKAQKHDDNIQRYNEFVNTQIDLASVSMNGASIVASLIPSGGASGFFLTSTEIRASLFSARGGYGLFGKKGLRVGGYKIEAMYANEVLGTGTIFSIKQVGKQGGNLLRWDYGILHGTQRIGLHSSFRLNLLGKTFGSTKQYPGIAPFKFWKYPKP